MDNKYCLNLYREVNKKSSGSIQKNMSDNFELYTKYLRSNLINSSDTFNTTYQTYFNNMKLFLEFVSKYEGDVSIISDEFQNSFSDIWEDFCNYCFERGNNKRTIANKRTAVSTFFDWCVRRRKIITNPFNYVDKMKITDNDKRRNSYFLTPKEIWEIKYVMRVDKKHFDIQDRLLFNLFVDSGCRISEIYGLKLEQLDLGEMVFNDVRHKEGYIEPVIFFQETKELLIEWLKERKEKGIENDYLFTTYYKGNFNHMSKEAIRGRVRKMGKIVGINDFYPHSIRKSILNITGKQSQTVAMALGHHKNVDVTIKHYMKKQKIYEIRNTLEQIRELSGI